VKACARACAGETALNDLSVVASALAIAIAQVRSLPGDGRPRPRQPASRTSFPITQQMRRGSTQGAVLVGGGPAVRYTSPFALAGGRIRAATPCASAQLQHPRQVGPPSRGPIRPKRAAISRLFAQNVKRDLARLEIGRSQEC
jgi:hypothetical protein